MHRNLLSYVVAALMATSLVACRQDPDYLNVRGTTWGTQYSITYRGDASLADSITAAMRQIDMSLSPFQPLSTVSAVNRGDTVAVDSMLSQVFMLSQQVCGISGGAFDPTVAPLVNAWGFGYRNGDGQTPDQPLIDSLLTSVGILDCHIDAAGHLIKKSPSTEFNFSAIAKGYGVDHVAAMLRRNGVTDYMVEIGGEIALSGHNIRGEKWHIQVDTPVDDALGINHDAAEQLCLTDVCIATSGNYRNYRDTPSGRVAHTISPITGYPVLTSTLSVTVIAPNCALADALATATMAMQSIDEALDMLSAAGAEAMIIEAAEPDGYNIIRTPDFNKYLYSQKQ